MCQQERMFSITEQKINLQDKDYGQRILDIGGGGEGIISLLLGKKVISIDPRKDELEEAPNGPLKIVMDARKLAFLDNSFDTVTSFFTLMYINKSDHKKVFNEVYRVLKKGGKFILWDVVIPRYDGGLKDIFVVPLEIKINDRVIKTAYGVSWKEKEQNIDYYLNLAEEVGFTIIKQESDNGIFKIMLVKN